MATRSDIPIAPNAVVSDTEHVYSVKMANFISSTYCACLGLEYIGFFMTLPLEDIRNRPATCALFECCLICAFVICCVLAPIGIAILPDQNSYYAHLLSTLFQIITFILGVVAVAEVYRVKEVMFVRVGKETVDFTVYVQVSHTCAFAVVVITLIISSVNTIFYGRALYRLANRISRVIPGKIDIPLSDLSNKFEAGKTIVNLDSESNSPDNQFPNDVLSQISDRFV